MVRQWQTLFFDRHYSNMSHIGGNRSILRQMPVQGQQGVPGGEARPDVPAFGLRALEAQTDFVKLAEAFGAKAERVDTLESLDEALGRAFRYEGPYLIDCLIGEDELAR